MAATDTNTKLTIRDISYVRNNGFKKDFGEIGQIYYWWRKNIPSHYFKNLHIIIDNNKILVFCSGQGADEGEGELQIISKPFTQTNLGGILRILKQVID